jgi:hypothetical protein
MLVILRSEARKDLVLLVVLSSAKNLGLLVILSVSEESGFDVILSASEGPGFDCHSERSEESGLAFERSLPQILHASGIQNDTLNLSQILRQQAGLQNDKPETGPQDDCLQKR